MIHHLSAFSRAAADGAHATLAEQGFDAEKTSYSLCDSGFQEWFRAARASGFLLRLIAVTLRCWNASVETHTAEAGAGSCLPSFSSVGQFLDGRRKRLHQPGHGRNHLLLNTWPGVGFLKSAAGQPAANEAAPPLAIAIPLEGSKVGSCHHNGTSSENFSCTTHGCSPWNGFMCTVRSNFNSRDTAASGGSISLLGHPVCPVYLVHSA